MSATVPISRSSLAWLRPPSSSLELWQCLALLAAVNSVAMAYQVIEVEFAVLVGLIWIGAFLCLEDRLHSLKLEPSHASLLLGSLLLLACLWRTAVVFHQDVAVYALVPLQGIALALLLAPASQLLNWREPLMILCVLPAVLVLHQLIPIEALMHGTAQATAALLKLIGQDIILEGTTVWLPNGGVNVNPSCSGRNTISQLFAVAAIFVVAFPLRQRWLGLLLLALSPLLGFLGNCFRIACLALINSSDWAEKKYWFDFFHESEGSLVFAAISVSVFAWGYLKIMDRQLAAQEAQHA